MSSTHNRQNRSLLFGGGRPASSASGARPFNTPPPQTSVDSSPSSAARAQGGHDEELLMAANEQGLAQLGGRVDLMKDVAVQIQGEVKNQNEMLDRAKGRFDDAKGLIEKLLSGLNGLAEDDKGNNRKFGAIVGSILLIFVLLYFWRRK
mmetsp:Transcript_17521/g.46657  ORF Transcript_17521/g.46657 Transcript_17521/m.46657 type:complete len:149 (-) Transcript_17521:60-506(-)